MAQLLSALANNALVKDTGTTYYGTPIIWRVADKNHSGYPANSVTLESKSIITLKCFDAIEASNSDSNRKKYGNNRYIYSNLRQWANSAAAAGAWYSAAHNKDAAPTNANVWSNYNEYDDEAGFLYGFSAKLREALMATTITVGKSSTDGGGTETCVDDIFFASCTEVGLSGDHACGSKLAVYSNDASRVAYPTKQCVSNSEYSDSSLAKTKGWYYWLRDAYASYSYSVRNVDTDGSLHHNIYACNGYRGVRPLCNLPSDIMVSDTTDSDGAYTIVWNEPPTDPSSITVPDSILADTAFSVSWGASSDPEGALSGYRLERKLGSGSFTQIYQGTSRTYSDTVSSGNTSVTYRVKAYDAEGSESGYATSDAASVLANSPPVISGSDQNLGTKTGPFSQSYTVTDADSGQTLTVVEKIDGVQVRSYNPASGVAQSFTVTEEQFLQLDNGSHTLTITASDQYNATATRTYTFSRTEENIEVLLAEPLAADAMPERITLTVSRQIPAGATFQVFVCNNAFDDEPTWEEITGAVVSGVIYYFTNETKTASEWGVNFKVLVARNTADSVACITSIGGNFD